LKLTLKALASIDTSLRIYDAKALCPKGIRLYIYSS
jgi:hypothetical protein